MKGRKPKKNPALLRRQRQEWFRTGVQAVFFLLALSVYASAFTVVKVGFSTLSQGLPLTWDAFTLQLVLVLSFTVLFGRFFCGWACAFGALGDWIYRFSQWIQKKTGRKLPRLSEAAVLRLQWCKYAVLLLILGLCFFGRSALVSRYSPWTVFSLLRSGKLPAGEYLAGWIPMVLILVGMALQERFLCQFLCPMGAIFALLPQTPFFRLKRNAAACLPNCGACRRMCPSALLLDEENPRQGECFRCGRCSGMPAATTRTGSVFTCRSSGVGSLQRCGGSWDGSTWGEHEEQVADGNTGLQDIVKNFFSGLDWGAIIQWNGGGTKCKSSRCLLKVLKIVLYDITLRMMVDQDRKWLYTFTKYMIRVSKPI